MRSQTCRARTTFCGRLFVSVNSPMPHEMTLLGARATLGRRSTQGTRQALEREEELLAVFCKGQTRRETGTQSFRSSAIDEEGGLPKHCERGCARCGSFYGGVLVTRR